MQGLQRPQRPQLVGRGMGGQGCHARRIAIRYVRPLLLHDAKCTLAMQICGRIA